MRIREENTISTGIEGPDPMDSIRELEEQYEAGEVEMHAYFMKKRSLIKML